MDVVGASSGGDSLVPGGDEDSDSPRGAMEGDAKQRRPHAGVPHVVEDEEDALPGDGRAEDQLQLRQRLGAAVVAAAAADGLLHRVRLRVLPRDAQPRPHGEPAGDPPAAEHPLRQRRLADAAHPDDGDDLSTAVVAHYLLHQRLRRALDFFSHHVGVQQRGARTCSNPAAAATATAGAAVLRLGVIDGEAQEQPILAYLLESAVQATNLCPNLKPSLQFLE
uniref:Uncharacterized protein n=1 Tax=Oryza nivara TaxID=4536 RepID=A0A0E0I8G3_ORYNI